MDMPDFSYRAIGKDGREIRGVIRAESESEAVFKIREDYPVLLKIRKKTEKRQSESILEMELGDKRINAKEMDVLCSQFAVVLKSGIPVARALQILAGQCSDKRLQSILEQVRGEVASGSSVAAAFEQHKERFSPAFIETIRAGEQSGTLDHAFERLHGFYEKTYKTAEKVKSAMTYPIFVAVVAVVVLVIVMAQVIPTLTGVITDLGGELPMITKLLIRISEFFASWWLLILGVFAGLAVFWQIFSKTKNGRLYRSKLMFSIPFLGAISRMDAAAQFLAAMTVLVDSGVPLEEAVSTAAKVPDNAVLEEEARILRDKLIQGRKMSECMGKSSCFPQIMADMCAVGEETGEISAALAYASEYCAGEAAYRSQRLLTMLEPALLVVLSVFVGFIVLSVYLPIFRMYDFM